MLKIGTGELIVILAVALIIFGPSRLPALGKMVGKAVGTLRHYADTENWAELDDEPKPRQQAAAQASAPEEAQETEQTASEPKEGNI